jgi:hypothetical protein
MINEETLEAKHERNQRQRYAFIKEWAEYVRTHPDEDWGEQVNIIIDSQLEAARHFGDERPNLDELDSPLLDDR